MGRTTRRGILGSGLATGLVLLLACGPPPRPAEIDLARLTDVPRPAVAALVEGAGAPDALLAHGIADPARRALIARLTREILADLTLFGAGAAERPRDVRIVLGGEGSEDVVRSQRALPLYRTLADALGAGELPRLAVADLVLKSRVAAIASGALDDGRTIAGATLTVVLEGLAHDGQNLLVSGG